MAHDPISEKRSATPWHPVTVRDAAEARAVTEIAARLDVAVLLVTEPDASGRYGPAYLLEMMRQAGLGDGCVHALIDCGDSAGQAMLALRLGWKDVHMTGPPDTTRRIAEMAESVGARFHQNRPACLQGPVDQSLEDQLRNAAAN
ncbi:MAG: hypothetical protein CMM46_07900 [Rhodospirillaceae bacterium]|nr:hypothetical protein [Rhodospirillaceae bacterium]